MKPFYLLALLLFFNGFYAQDFKGFNQGGTPQKKYSVSLPYKEIKGKLVVQVSIEGKPYDFLLDTGAPTSISDKVYAAYKPAKMATINISDQSGINDSITVVNLKNISLGTLAFKDIPTLYIKNMGVMGCLGIDGIIGSNLLRNSILQISPKTKTITITDMPKPLQLNRKNSVAMTVDARQSDPLISIVFETEKIDVNEQILIDTGMTGFYDLSAAVYKNAERYNVFNMLNSAVGAYSLGLNGVAQNAQSYKVHVPNITIGKFMFTDVTANTTNDSRSRMGTDLLKYGTITLDYIGKRFYFEPFNGQQQISMAEKTWPVDLVLKNKKATIGIVWDAGLQDKLKAGDIVLKFGDFDYSAMDECAVAIADTKMIKSPAELIVKDADTGEIKKLELERK